MSVLKFQISGSGVPECRFVRSLADDLFRFVGLWRNPHVWLWMAVSAAASMAVRLPLSMLDLIPGGLAVRCDIIVAPIAGILWGPAGAVGCCVASLAGDWLFGSGGLNPGYAAAGFFLAALGAHAMGQCLSPSRAMWFSTKAGYNRGVFFMVAATPGCFAAAAWTALGYEIGRVYPFPYIVGLALLSNLILTILFGLPLFQAVGLKAGLWMGVFPEDGFCSGSLRRRVLVMGGIAAGGAGACLAGIYVAKTVYRMGFLEPFVIGIACGPWVPVAVAAFLLLHAAAAFSKPETRNLKPE